MIIACIAMAIGIFLVLGIWSDNEKPERDDCRTEAHPSPTTQTAAMMRAAIFLLGWLWLVVGLAADRVILALDRMMGSRSK